ncbi:MAG: fumarylacetoacetate hydrolase family protein [Jatrophihabitantaceae bacterium]
MPVQPDETQPLAPVLSTVPGKVVAVHLNYPSRAAQRGRTPQHPSYFLKPPSSLSAPGAPIVRPAGCELLGFEGEIALVIGERTRAVRPDQGWSRVRWVTAANDVGVYDLRYADRGSNLLAKGRDGFTPVGPALLDARELDPSALRLRTWLDDELVQDDSSDTLLFDFGLLVADLSHALTLEAGDLILTGTPAGASVARPGQTVAVEVSDGVRSTGRLCNPVVESADPYPDFGAPPVADQRARAEAFGTAPSAPDPLPRRVREALGRVGTATLSSQLRKRGLHNMTVDGVLPLRAGSRFVGVARTLQFLPLREDLFDRVGGGMNAQKLAMDAVGPGEVLVIDARREPEAGTVGDILALRAQVRGAAAIVTDGAVRDSAALAALELPIFAAARHPAVLGRRHVPWAVDVTVACGGTVVAPGDVLVGDADGVLVLPPELAEQVAFAAVEQELQERFIAEQVAGGASVEGLYPIGPRWQQAYERWQAALDSHRQQEDSHDVR